MSYTLLGSAASWLAAHAMTAAGADAEYHGGCDSDPNEGVLVLDDGGNQHALIIEGTDDELRAFAKRVADAVTAITEADKVTYKVGDPDPTPEDDRIVCGAEVRDPEGDNFFCTWPQYHLHHQHIAGDGGTIEAAWPARS